MKLAGLGVERRARAVSLSVGPGEQVLKALHGGLHILKGKKSKRLRLFRHCGLTTARD